MDFADVVVLTVALICNSVIGELVGNEPMNLTRQENSAVVATRKSNESVDNLADSRSASEGIFEMLRSHPFTDDVQRDKNGYAIIEDKAIDARTLRRQLSAALSDSGSQLNIAASLPKLVNTRIDRKKIVKNEPELTAESAEPLSNDFHAVTTNSSISSFIASTEQRIENGTTWPKLDERFPEGIREVRQDIIQTTTNAIEQGQTDGESNENTLLYGGRALDGTGANDGSDSPTENTSEGGSTIENTSKAAPKKINFDDDDDMDDDGEISTRRSRISEKQVDRDIKKLLKDYDEHSNRVATQSSKAHNSDYQEDDDDDDDSDDYDSENTYDPQIRTGGAFNDFGYFKLYLLIVCGLVLKCVHHL